ncbi:MAG: DNA polymerase III subunit gamma/tau [Ruminococcus sp.]|jgi:DNA polymerase-3 subunit gamma/tau|nr:DNA polymerase III subunit gamma/tau [Ruminococcus sp.]
MYQALYRKYRPRTFTDVVAQEHITTTLQNQIRSGKTAHAYLFTGPRGTGKTTCARIFAKAINCLNPKDGNPCLECEICKEADTGSLPDIIEIDAASNNSVNDVRDLREASVYTPEICKVKIYIIDEVHMLTKDAFNALLKIMEEPPPHVKFILATTELHKVIPTVISRCQRFDFHRVSVKDIADTLKITAKLENIKISDEAAKLIAKTADGGMRDGLSMLDTCMAFGSEVTLEIVSAAAGIAGRSQLFELIKAIADKNAPTAVEIVDRMYSDSKDLMRLVTELVEQFRNIMMIKALPEGKETIAVLPEELVTLTELAEKLSMTRITSTIITLQKLSESLARAVEKRTSFEIAIIKLCEEISQKTQEVRSETQNNASNSALIERIRQLEMRVTMFEQAPGASTPTRPETGTVAKNETNTSARPEASPPGRPAPNIPDLSKLTVSDFAIFPDWENVLTRFGEIEPHITATLAGSRALFYENILLIIAENRFFLELIKRKENAERLQSILRSITGKQFFIRAKCTTPESTANSSPAARIIETAQKNNIPVKTDE